MVTELLLESLPEVNQAVTWRVVVMTTIFIPCMGDRIRAHPCPSVALSAFL